MSPDDNLQQACYFSNYNFSEMLHLNMQYRHFLIKNAQKSINFLNWMLNKTKIKMFFFLSVDILEFKCFYRGTLGRLISSLHKSENTSFLPSFYNKLLYKLGYECWMTKPLCKNPE